MGTGWGKLITAFLTPTQNGEELTVATRVSVPSNGNERVANAIVERSGEPTRKRRSVYRSEDR